MAKKHETLATPPDGQSKRGFNGRRPIVVKVKRRNKKAKYTKGTKDFQVAFRRATQLTNEISNAVSAGVGRFEKKSKASSRKRKDGLLQDMVPNMVSATGKGLRESTKVPALAAKLITARPSFGQRLVDGLRKLMRRLRGR